VIVRLLFRKTPQVILWGFVFGKTDWQYGLAKRLSHKETPSRLAPRGGFALERRIQEGVRD
ncbi:hypothetical protein, partial [Achromobacter marplatensis]|uniref:hypothetical protein n=1 Tax=Achromobacter marplatensis TaxID=470868 RepID=UPI0035EB0487